MTIDTNGFEIGDEVWCKLPTLKSPSLLFEPLLYGKAMDDTGFSVVVKTNDNDYMIICHSNCFHTQQECQLACNELNSKM